MKEKKTLDFKLEIKQLDEDGTIEGYGAIFGNRDRYDDIIEQGAFNNSLLGKSASEVKMLWQHNSDEPIGVWDEIREDSKGLYCKGHILINTTKGADVYKMLKGGALSGLSIGYNIIKSCREEIEENEDIRKLKEVELWEISIVTFPANPLSNITSVKSVNSFLNLPIATKDSEWNKTEADKRIRELTGSEDKPSDSYKEYFMYHDDEDKENFGAYKLPFADVIDGKAHIVPRAVFSMVNERGLKEDIKGKVNTLYAKFRTEFEDDTLISPFEDKKSLIEKWELKEFDRFLKNSSLTNSEIKIFRKRYLELHSPKEEVKEIDEKNLVKTKEQDVDDEKNKKSLEEIKNKKESPEEITKEKKESPEEKKNIQILENILKILQKY